MKKEEGKGMRGKTDGDERKEREKDISAMRREKERRKVREEEVKGHGEGREKRAGIRWSGGNRCGRM